jgi:hypothetical protein
MGLGLSRALEGKRAKTNTSPDPKRTGAFLFLKRSQT